MSEKKEVKLGDMRPEDIEGILKTVCDELSANQSSIRNINHFMKVNDSVDRHQREGYQWSYALNNDASTNSTGTMVEFTFAQVRIGKTFDVTIGLPEYAYCDRIESFEITYDRYESGNPISLEELKTSFKNRTVIK